MDIYNTITYDEFREHMMNKYFIEDIAAFGHLQYQISGQYDSTAIESVIRFLYNEGNLSKWY